jgi:cell division inhibitor SulA
MNTVPALHHLNAWERTSSSGSSLVVPTGIPALDELLPAGGWPKSGLVEITVPDENTDAITLLLPALARLSLQGRRVVMVTPPYQTRVRVFTAAGMNTSSILQVNAHPGRSGLWTVESMLRTGDCSMVLAWPACVTELMEKKLKNAATLGKTTAVLFRLEGDSAHISTADVRLRLEADESGSVVYLQDRHGGRQCGAELI